MKIKPIGRRRFLVYGTAALGSSVLLKACTSPTATTSSTSPEASPATDASPAPSPTSPVAAGNLTNIRFMLDWVPQGIHAPLAVAIEKGFFAEEGLNVSFDRGSGSTVAISKVASGNYELAMGDVNSLPEFNQKNPQTQVRAVAVYYNKSPMAIATLKESGISEPKMLEGKTMATPSGSAVRRMFPLFAQATGIDFDKVEQPVVEPKLQTQLLANKQVDSIGIFTVSTLPNLQDAGFDEGKLNLFRFVEHGLNLYGNSILARADFLEQRPEVVQAFLRAFTKGVQDTLKDPDGAIQMMAKYDSTFKVPLERKRLQLAIDTLITSPEVEQNGFGGVDEARFETTLKQVVDGFKLTQTPKLKDVFNPDFLPPKEQRMLTV